MSQLDIFYEEMYAKRLTRKDEHYCRIIKDFENLTLEEKVNKLIRIYATEQAYN